MTESTFTHPTQPWQVTVYKSGNSKVITLPAKSQVKIGDTFSVKEGKKQLVLKKVPVNDLENRLKLLSKAFTPIPGLSEGKNIEELEKSLEGIYE